MLGVHRLKVKVENGIVEFNIFHDLIKYLTLDFLK